MARSYFYDKIAWSKNLCQNRHNLQAFALYLRIFGAIGNDKWKSFVSNLLKKEQYGLKLL